MAGAGSGAEAEAGAEAGAGAGAGAGAEAGNTQQQLTVPKASKFLGDCPSFMSWVGSMVQRPVS